MADKRPVNLDIGSMSLPITAYVSILHRLSGVAVFFSIGFLLWLLHGSLASEAGFNQIKEQLASGWQRIVLWLILSALAYHLVAGVKHLLMDLGIGESLKGGIWAARVSLGIAALLILLITWKVLL